MQFNNVKELFTYCKEYSETYGINDPSNSEKTTMKNYQFDDNHLVEKLLLINDSDRDETGAIISEVKIGSLEIYDYLHNGIYENIRAFVNRIEKVYLDTDKLFWKEISVYFNGGVDSLGYKHENLQKLGHDFESVLNVLEADLNSLIDSVDTKTYLQPTREIYFIAAGFVAERATVLNKEPLITTLEVKEILRTLGFDGVQSKVSNILKEFEKEGWLEVHSIDPKGFKYYILAEAKEELPVYEGCGTLVKIVGDVLVKNPDHYVFDFDETTLRTDYSNDLILIAHETPVIEIDKSHRKVYAVEITLLNGEILIFIFKYNHSLNTRERDALHTKYKRFALGLNKNMITGVEGKSVTNKDINA